MTYVRYPVIDLPATGENILRLRESRGFSVRDLQQFFGFDAPQAIYKWQRGQTLPSVDNLFALSALFQVPIDDILIPVKDYRYEQQASACCSAFLNRLLRIRRESVPSIHQFFAGEAVLQPAGRFSRQEEIIFRGNKKYFQHQGGLPRLFGDVRRIGGKMRLTDFACLRWAAVDD